MELHFRRVLNGITGIYALRIADSQISLIIIPKTKQLPVFEQNRGEIRTTRDFLDLGILILFRDLFNIRVDYG